MKMKVVERKKDLLPSINEKPTDIHKIQIVPDTCPMAESDFPQRQEKSKTTQNNENNNNNNNNEQQQNKEKKKIRRVRQQKPKSQSVQQQKIEGLRQKAQNRNNSVWNVIYQQSEKNAKNQQKLKQKNAIEFFEEFFLNSETPQYLDNKNQLKNTLYQQSYGEKAYEEMLAQQLNLSDTLEGKECKVSQQLRSKMVDWMVEVFSNFSETTSQYTYFRAVEIMDYYIKHKTQVNKKKVTDGDIHKLGVSCIFIASKLEDRMCISLEDIYLRVCHKKFSMEQIKAQEWDVLKTLNFDIQTPTPFEFYRYYMCQLFQEGDHQIIHDLYETGKMIMKIVLIDDCLRCFPQHVIALCGVQQAVILFIQILFNDQSQQQSKFTEEKLQKGLSIITHKLKSYLEEKDIQIFNSINLQLQESLANPDDIDFKNVLKYQTSNNYLYQNTDQKK